MPPSAVDVLILGAGLAGLRAALSCLESDPGLRVLVASLTAAPSGSSFANQNDALGMHVCRSDADREAYQREVPALNQGASLSPELLAVQADEGLARLRDLMALGLNFTRDAQGDLLGHSSCFSPHSRRAFIFTGLSSAFTCFTTHLESLGCLFAPGWMAASIVTDRGTASGAVLVSREDGEPVFVAAKAVVAALGGPGRLFAHSMAGPGTPGYSHGLLSDAGAVMANLGYLQFMWATAPGKSFWQPAALGAGGYRLAMPDGRTIPVEELLPGLPGLCLSRAGHCPFGYGLEDSALDLALATGLDDAGILQLIQPDGAPLRLAPMAHASNGGALIDEHGQTSVPGLLACGECATGMHGSNRLGGGMVLATQVFGHRAGCRAALIARDVRNAMATGNAGAVRDESMRRITGDAQERAAGLKWLATGLSRFAVLGGRPGHEFFADQVRKRLEDARDWKLCLGLKTGLGILSNLPGTDLHL